MKRRTKRFNGAEGSDVRSFISDAQERVAEQAKRGTSGEGTPTKQGSFGAEFKAARARGAKTFNWNGKWYTTELAKPAPKTEPKPTTTTTKSESKPSASETKAARSTTSKDDDFSAAGTKLTYDVSKAKAAPGKQPKAPKERIEPHFSEMKDINPRKTPDNSPRRLTMTDAPRLIGRGGGGGGGGAGTRHLMLGSELDPKALMRENRGPRDDDEARFADEGNPNYKRGGKVKKYAKGGSVASSASKRADGIATKGKTKGRMV